MIHFFQQAIFGCLWLYFKRTCNKEVITLQIIRAICNVNPPTKFLLLTSLTTSFLPLRSKRCIFSTAFLTESADSNSTIPHPLGLSFSSWNSSTYATSPTGNKETQLYAAIFSTPGLSTLFSFWYFWNLSSKCSFYNHTLDRTLPNMSRTWMKKRTFLSEEIFELLPMVFISNIWNKYTSFCCTFLSTTITIPFTFTLSGMTWTSWSKTAWPITPSGAVTFPLSTTIFTTTATTTTTQVGIIIISVITGV